MTFNVCVKSVSAQEPGWVNLSIYNNITQYLDTTIGIELHQFHVDANQTNCSTYTYVVPIDDFYYASSGVPDVQTHFAKIVSFRIDVEILYINRSNFLHGSTSYSVGVCNPIDESEIECSVEISHDRLFSARNYDILASSTTSSKEDQLALVRWKLSFQKQWYTVPVIAGAILAFLVFLICVAYRKEVFGCRYCVNWIKEQRGGYMSLDTQHPI